LLIGTITNTVGLSLSHPLNGMRVEMEWYWLNVKCCLERPKWQPHYDGQKRYKTATQSARSP
jgi:hypothetical protein